MSIYGISTEFTVHMICNDCSLNGLIFGQERIEMGANKYQKGIQNSSANSVNQKSDRK